MTVSSVVELVHRRSGAYWRDLVFGRLLPSVFFSLFLVRQLVLLSGSLKIPAMTRDMNRVTLHLPTLPGLTRSSESCAPFLASMQRTSAR